MNGEDKKEVSMPILYLQRLNNRIEEKDRAFANGDVMMAYRCLRNILVNIYFRLDEKEIEELEKIFNKVRNLLSNESPKAMQMNITIAELELDKLDKKINGLLWKYDLIFPTDTELNTVRFQHVGF